MHAVEDTGQVDRDQPIPLLAAGALDRPGREHACVVDEQVDTTLLPADSLDGSANACAIGDIEPQRCALAHVGAKNHGSVLGESRRDALADTARCAGYEGDLAAQFVSHQAENVISVPAKRTRAYSMSPREPMKRISSFSGVVRNSYSGARFLSGSSSGFG